MLYVLLAPVRALCLILYVVCTGVCIPIVLLSRALHLPHWVPIALAWPFGAFAGICYGLMERISGMKE